MEDGQARRGGIVCLLPARNAADDLPRWLESAPDWCDAVVALDDGSTDATGRLLAQAPIVTRLLSNPQRDSYAGWHDAGNRNMLLEAVEELSPDWVVYVDADELIPPDDAAALREFLATDALRGCAYGLVHHRMWGDDRYDPATSIVFRVFAWEPGQRLPDDRLYGVPVPEAIGANRMVPTSIRLQHFAGSTPERQRRWREKYDEADPGGTPQQPGYTMLDREPPPDAPQWAPRDPEMPALLVPMLAPRGSRAERAKVLCLLPARNASAHLPEWLESVARFADGVIALDDGSTDDTAVLLADSPLVCELLRNPRRDGYAGWDDAGNRNRLLEAAAAHAPDWIVQLDADERIEPGDAVALRALFDGGAPDDCALGFRVFRMAGDSDHYDEARLWVYRAFTYAPGQRMPDRKLHLVPVPTSIPNSRWLPTNVRIAHLGGVDEDRRREALPEVPRG